MSRRSFGFWGRELDLDDFARAVAALGVLQGNGPLRLFPGEFRLLAERYNDDVEFVSIVVDHLQRILDARTDGIIGWELREMPPSSGSDGPAGRVPRALAQAWAAMLALQDQRSQFVNGGPGPRQRPLRIEVRLGIGDDARETWQDRVSPEWLVDTLSRPAVNVDSVYLRLGRPTFGRFSPHWHWPLSIGFLDDPISRELRRSFEEFCRAEHPWVLHQVELVEVRPNNPRCDLLILLVGLIDALPQLMQAAARATMVLILADIGQPWQRAAPLLAAIQSQVEASGLALCQVGDADRLRFFKGLVRQLSHNLGLDMAIYHAHSDLERLDTPLRPLVLVDPRLLTASRLSTVADRLTRQVELSVTSLTTLDGVALMELGEVQHSMDGRHDFSFFREQDGGSMIATAGRMLRDVLDPVVEPRFLQAHVYDVTRPDEPQRLAQGFRANAPHAVDVWIGPFQDDAITADVQFPDRDLLDEQVTHRITVAFVDLGSNVEPQVAEIVLPRLGISESCRFFLHTAQHSGRLEARIVMLHGNRVLQTLLLRGPVADTADGLSDGARIELIQEVVARVRLDDLGSRRKFDAALVINHGQDGQSRAMVAIDDEVEIWEPTGLDQRVEYINRRLEQVVREQDSFFKVGGDGMRTLLVDLARHGSILFNDLARQQVTNRLTRKGVELIQVVNAQPKAHYPMEFVYDRKSPSPNAEVCPNAAAALAKGACPVSCASRDERAYVCPLGFWCMTKVIERVPYGSEKIRASRHYVARTETSARLKHLSTPLAGAVVAASDFAGKARVRSVVKRLTKAIGTNVQLATTWDQWTMAIKTGNPPLLVLLPHTVLDSAEIWTMEISAEAELQHLPVDQVDDTYVKIASADGPIVLLLGCKTANTEEPMADFVSAFYDSGAAVVLATLTKVLGEHAVPVASQIAAALIRKSTEDGETFGDVLLKLRRRFLARGLPMVLALTYYGDADWILGRPTP